MNEFSEYCKENTISGESCPLEWWKMNKSKYPNLSRMTRDFLGIPGASVMAERGFSSARQLITDFRCSLSPESIQACQCLKYWL